MKRLLTIFILLWFMAGCASVFFLVEARSIFNQDVQFSAEVQAIIANPPAWWPLSVLFWFGFLIMLALLLWRIVRFFFG